MPQGMKAVSLKAIRSESSQVYFAVVSKKAFRLESCQAEKKMLGLKCFRPLSSL
jgi:hypothetical protein